jgi:hypothetical protein
MVFKLSLSSCIDIDEQSSFTKTSKHPGQLKRGDDPVHVKPGYSTWGSTSLIGASGEVRKFRNKA